MSDINWDHYETGPFCRHWFDPSDCDVHCTTCGHKCTDHEFGKPGECMVEGCGCKKWEDNDS